MEPITSALRKVCTIFNRHSVEYMLIGGHAVAFHGFPRTTADIDLWFNPTIENYSNLLQALKELGEDVSELQEEVFRPENTFLCIAAHGIKMEFLSSIPGSFSYREAALAAVQTEIEGVPLKVIGLKHLIENKSALNRPIDKLDVEELKKRNSKK